MTVPRRSQLCGLVIRRRLVALLVDESVKIGAGIEHARANLDEHWTAASDAELVQQRRYCAASITVIRGESAGLVMLPPSAPMQIEARRSHLQSVALASTLSRRTITTGHMMFGA
jgi:hypothetical protein